MKLIYTTQRAKKKYLDIHRKSEVHSVNFFQNQDGSTPTETFTLRKFSIHSGLWDNDLENQIKAGVLIILSLIQS